MMTKKEFKDFAKSLHTKLSVQIYEGEIWISSIFVLKRSRGKGYATQVIRKIQEEAAKNNKKVKLLASDVFGTKLETLIKFYKGLGFVEDYSERRPNSKFAQDYFVWEK